MNVTREQWPCIYNVCEAILYDHGAINRLEPEPVAITLPADDTFNMADANMALRRLSDEERETFAIGESSAQLTVATRNRHLAWLSCVLNLWFEQGMPCERMTS